MTAAGRIGPIARQAIKFVAAGADLIRRPEPGITILIYHRVGAGAGGQMDLAPRAFDEQLRWLRATQRVISLDEAVDELGAHSPAGREPGRMPPGVVLTFDDGTTDWVEHVLPALERTRTPATFYLATSFVEEQTEFSGGGVPLSWAGVAELASSELVTIGSHTHTHALLDRVDADQVDDELDRSIELIGEHTGDRPVHFAYPKALPGNSAADAAVRSRFRSAVVAGGRANTGDTDPHLLQRSPIQPSDGQRWFKRKALGGMAAEDQMRELLNRVRFRGATQ